MPEKAQKQVNFCLLPAAEYLLQNKPEDGGAEPIMWTVNDGPTKNYAASQEFQPRLGGTEYVLEDALHHLGILVGSPNEAEFASATPESHRKNEKAYHVKAFKGNKEGQSPSRFSPFPATSR